MVHGFGSATGKIQEYLDQYSRILYIRAREVLVKSKVCDYTPWGGLTEINPYEPDSYVVTLNLPVLNKYNNLLEVLAHEMIHVWQLSTGKLQFDDTKRLILYNGESHLEYGAAYYSTESPWEQEAYDNQKKLYGLAKDELYGRNYKSNNTGIRISTLT